MVSNYLVKCNICGRVCNLKYQLGFSKKHPIRYKCMCGVSIRGEYREEKGIEFENATMLTEQGTPNYVVVSSGEFLQTCLFKLKILKKLLDLALL